MTAYAKKYLPLIPWAVPAILCAVLSGCGTTGLYCPNSHRLDAATRAFLAKDFSAAKPQFTALAQRKGSPEAAAAGRYGLACLAMATAKDIPSFQEAMETFSRFPDAQRFEHQNPLLLFAGVKNGIRLLEKRQAEQNRQIRKLLDEKKRADQHNNSLEQSLKNLKYQLKEIERIDRDLQEKRNPS